MLFVYRKDESSSVIYSRYITHAVEITDWNPHELLQCLQALSVQVPEHLPLVVFPTNDPSLLAFIHIRAQLSPRFVDALPSPELVTLCLYKDRFYEYLSRNGVPHPRSIALTKGGEISLAGNGQMPYPFALKPALSHVFMEKFHRKLFAVYSARELEMYCQKISGQEISLIMQELIQGEELHLIYFYVTRRGEASAVVGFRKIRQSPPDYGTASMVELYWNQELVERTLQLTRRLGYTGLGEAEYRYDPRDGEFKLLEINPRSNTFNRLSARLGVDLEYQYYLDALGSLSCTNGVLHLRDKKARWVDFSKDIPTILALRQQNRLPLGALLSSFRHLKMDGYFAVDDPAPFLYALKEFLKGGIRKKMAARESR
ncbi:MAG: hypothetical protein D6681_03755 [Calditrichaeota bacterium]|nr:MAG: hypothetical protein D6681_03755 [Calditrichota bacterium]